MIDPFAKLSLMVDAAGEPKLIPAEIESVLADFARRDKNGVAPSAPEWIPTYDFKRAAAEGWRRKAAKAAELISADLDGERMSSNQIFDHCERMVALYSRRGTGSTSIGQS